MKTTSGQVVLVTGASSGIGKATAEYLMGMGYHVYGTSRKASGTPSGTHSSNDSASGGFIDMIPLDVNSDESAEKAIETILERAGRIDVLVSNAGNGIAGSVEDSSMEECRKQLETNFFGSLRMIKKVLPVMREQGTGKIVVVGSVAGVISIPFQSMYSASKFALEALVEALRHEIAPFGIQACLVEPGDTKTGFTASREEAAATRESTPYRERFKKSVSRMEHDEQNGASPIAVAKAVHRMILKKNPPIRTAVGFSYKAIIFLKRIIPSRIAEKIIGMLYS